MRIYSIALAILSLDPQPIATGQLNADLFHCFLRSLSKTAGETRKVTKCGNLFIAFYRSHCSSY